MRGCTSGGGEDIGLALGGRSFDVSWRLIALWPLPAPDLSSTFEIRWASGTPVLSKWSIKVGLSRSDFDSMQKNYAQAREYATWLPPLPLSYLFSAA